MLTSTSRKICLDLPRACMPFTLRGAEVQKQAARLQPFCWVQHVSGTSAPPPPTYAVLSRPLHRLGWKRDQIRAQKRLRGDQSTSIYRGMGGKKQNPVSLFFHTSWEESRRLRFYLFCILSKFTNLESLAFQAECKDGAAGFMWPIQTVSLCCNAVPSVLPSVGVKPALHTAFLNSPGNWTQTLLHARQQAFHHWAPSSALQLMCSFVETGGLKKVSLCNPGTCFVEQTGLELRGLPASAFRVLGLKVCTHLLF